jgi:hypothetical protein
MMKWLIAKIQWFRKWEYLEIIKILFKDNTLIQTVIKFMFQSQKRLHLTSIPFMKNHSPYFLMICWIWMCKKLNVINLHLQ